MPFICKICEKCPTSHSLVKFEETPERIVYYTRPSNATNNETDGIIQHYDGVLSEMNGKDWIWILDLNGFGMKNFMEIGNGIALARLITEKFSEHLQKIIVINQNAFTNAIYAIVKPFLSESVQKLVVFPPFPPFPPLEKVEPNHSNCKRESKYY
jgi:hypothetical protein